MADVFAIQDEIAHLTHAGLYDRAIEQANEALETDATNFVPHLSLGEAYVAMERWPDAVRALEQAHRLIPEDALATGLLAGALVRIDDTTRAEGLIREMGEAPRPIFGRVLYHLVCLEMEQAADWYERAVEQRDPFALIFADGPLGSAFRQSAHWPRLARMMNLPDAS